MPKSIAVKKPTTTKVTAPKSPKNDVIIGVDVDPTLYDLTDTFHQFYMYHNSDCLIGYDTISFIGGTADKPRMQHKQKSLSRFEALRRIEASRLGSRPYIGGKGLASHKPNVSFGYLRQLLEFLRLPYKGVFSDSDYFRVRYNKRLYNENKLSKEKKEELSIQEASNPNLSSNAEISDDISDAFNDVLRISKETQKVFKTICSKIPQEGAVAILHYDNDYRSEVIPLLDLITEPQAEWDPSTWSSFFVIKKLTAAKVRELIRKNEGNPNSHWNTNALRWALEDAANNNSIINASYTSYNSYYHDSRYDQTDVQGENFSVKSFMGDKASRRTQIESYYGNMWVVEGYFLNTKGTVDKRIFFPSETFSGVSHKDRKVRSKYTHEELKKEGLFGAGLLFSRDNVYNSMSEAITVIPFDRSEPSLERQRAYGHELFGPIEILGRVDSAIIHTLLLMGTPFYKNMGQGETAQTLEDLEISFDDEAVNLGEREFVNSPFVADLNSMIAARQVILQHIISKSFLGGLDNQQTSGNRNAHHIAGLQLIRDGRVHKENIEDFSLGLRDFGSKTLSSIFKLNLFRELNALPAKFRLVKHRFFDVLINVHNHIDKLFEYNQDEVLPDTHLPYYMDLEPVRNGGSHFGAAEMVLYTEAMNTFGAGLNQQAQQNITRMGLKSLFGSQDAIDILGDPEKNLVSQQDQIYRAMMENAGILGSVDNGITAFEPVPVLQDKDDHILHLTEVHNVKLAQLEQILQEADQVPTSLDDLTEEQLETRNNLILKHAALALHVKGHLDQLDKFGSDRDDVNELKEITNGHVQTSEGLLNNLQMQLRALQTKREETRLRLQNLSPENEAEKAKAELDLAKLSLQERKDSFQLQLANKIADQKAKEHVDKQVSKARDRRQREKESQRKAQVELEKMEIQAMNSSPGSSN